MARSGNQFVPGGAEVGQALRDAAAALGQGEAVVKEVSGGFEAPGAVVDYYAKVTVTPTGEEPGTPGTPGEPEPEPGEEPHPDNTLPGPGSAGGEHPDNTLPEPEVPTEPVDPDSLPHPDNTLPGPGSAGGEHPDNTLPEPEVPVDPDSLPHPDNTLPGPGSAGGEHPDNTLPTPEPQPEPGEPDNPLTPIGEIPDASWPIEDIRAWAAEHGITLSTGMRKDDILVVIQNEAPEAQG
jgi:hypothetical protein